MAMNADETFLSLELSPGRRIIFQSSVSFVHDEDSGNTILFCPPSRVDIAEVQVKERVRSRILWHCLSVMKATWFGRRRMLRLGFCGLKRWKDICRILRPRVLQVAHVAQIPLPSVVNSHTLSSMAKVSQPTTTPNEKSRTPLHTAQVSTSRRIPVATKKKGRASTPNTAMRKIRLQNITARYVHTKYFSPVKDVGDPARESELSAQLSSTRTSSSVRALAAHPLYRNITAAAESIGLSLGQGGAGLPLAKASLHRPLPQALQVQAVQFSPGSPTSTAAAGASVSSGLHLHSFSPVRSPLTPGSPKNCLGSSPGSFAFGLTAEWDSTDRETGPDAVEVAYARSRGSACLWIDGNKNSGGGAQGEMQVERRDEGGSPGGWVAARTELPSAGTSYSSGTTGMGRGGKLQALLRNYRSVTGPASILPTISHFHTSSQQATSGEVPQQVCAEEPSQQVAVSPETSASSPSSPTEVSKVRRHGLRRWWRRTQTLQESRTAELEGQLRGAEHYCSRRLLWALAVLRGYRRSFSPELLQVSQNSWRWNALTKAFWALRRRVTGAYRQQYLLLRGWRYHHLVSLSKGFSAFVHAVSVAAAADRSVKGDQGIQQQLVGEPTGAEREAASDKSSAAADDPYCINGEDEHGDLSGDGSDGDTGYEASDHLGSDGSEVGYANPPGPAGEVPAGSGNRARAGSRSSSSTGSSESSDAFLSAPPPDGEDQVNFTASLLTPLSQWSGSQHDESGLDFAAEAEMEQGLEEGPGEREDAAVESVEQEESVAAELRGGQAGMGGGGGAGMDSCGQSGPKHSPSASPVPVPRAPLELSAYPSVPSVLAHLAREPTALASPAPALSPYKAHGSVAWEESKASTTRDDGSWLAHHGAEVDVHMAPPSSDDSGVYRQRTASGEGSDGSEISLFLSSDSELGDEEPAAVRHAKAHWESPPPLPQSPPPLPTPQPRPVKKLSQTVNATTSKPQSQHTFADPAQLNNSSIVGGNMLHEAAAYYRRTLLLQGLYRLGQWALRSQSAATMAEVLYQYRAARAQRKALEVLKVHAML